MSNIAGPVSPLSNNTMSFMDFTIDRLLRISEDDLVAAGNNGAAHHPTSSSLSDAQSLLFESQHPQQQGTTTTDPTMVASSAAPLAATADATRSTFYPDPHHHQHHDDCTINTNSTASSFTVSSAAASIMTPAARRDSAIIESATASAHNFVYAVFGAAAHDDWNRVTNLCVRMHDKVNNQQQLQQQQVAVEESSDATMTAADQQQPPANATLILKKDVIELAQDEFEAAYATKNIKRRQNALAVVAHLFATAKLLSEKVVVSAMYRALEPPSSSSSTSNNSNSNPKHHHTSHHHSPPLHALLAVARALDICSTSFKDIGLQHLSAFVNKLCNGLITTAPNKDQHDELCEAIRRQSAVMHGFRS